MQEGRRCAAGIEVFPDCLLFVKGNSHDSVRCVESFLYAISMMNIYVNVQNSLMKS